MYFSGADREGILRVRNVENIEICKIVFSVESKCTIDSGGLKSSDIHFHLRCSCQNGGINKVWSSIDVN